MPLDTHTPAHDAAGTILTSPAAHGAREATLASWPHLQLHVAGALVFGAGAEDGPSKHAGAPKLHTGGGGGGRAAVGALQRADCTPVGGSNQLGLHICKAQRGGGAGSGGVGEGHTTQGRPWSRQARTAAGTAIRQCAAVQGCNCCSSAGRELLSGRMHMPQGRDDTTAAAADAATTHARATDRRLPHSPMHLP